MEWSNELILLAPRLLPDRKLIEDADFVDLYTKVEGEPSNNELYLLFKFTTEKRYYYLLNYMMKQKYFWNTTNVHKDKQSYILFIFRSPEKEWDNFETLKLGSIGYTLQYDWAPIFIFWGDRLREMPRFYDEHILRLERVLKKGLLQKQPLCFYCG